MYIALVCDSISLYICKHMYITCMSIWNYLEFTDCLAMAPSHAEGHGSGKGPQGKLNDSAWNDHLKEKVRVPNRIIVADDLHLTCRQEAYGLQHTRHSPMGSSGGGEGNVGTSSS